MPAIIEWLKTQYSDINFAYPTQRFYHNQVKGQLAVPGRRHNPVRLDELPGKD